MKILLGLMMLFAEPAPAPAPVPLAPPAPARPALPVTQLPGPAWSPVSDYVTPGQDEPGYRRWIGSQPWRAPLVASFHRYLGEAGVAYVVPTWQLLRTASDWQRCGAEPFEVPPAEEWANVVQTLRYVRDHVVPAVGPVEPVSVYRNPALNECAGGAPESVHKQLSAIDMVPLRPIHRPDLIRRLCTVHATSGPRYAVGLGFYTRLRFHVDSWRFRTWGRDDHGELACNGSVQPQGDPVIAQGPTGDAAK
jgi:hypothetical protein